MNYFSVSALLSLLLVLALGGEVPSGHLRQRNLGHYAFKKATLRYVHEILSESNSDDPARVAWRLFRGSDGKGEVSNEDTVKSVSALDGDYREGLFPVTLSTKGGYCIRVFRGDGTEFDGDSYTTNTVSLIERKQRFTGSWFNFWSLNDDDNWETISSEVVSSVNLYMREVGLKYDCFTVNRISGKTFKDYSVKYWKSNGTCKDSEFYHLSSKIEDPTEIVGLVKLIYAPAVSKSNEAVKRDFLAAVEEMSEPGATCHTRMRDEALDFFCLEKWYKSTSTTLKYLTMIVGNGGSLGAIATGKTLEAMLQLIRDVILSTAKKALLIPSHVDVMNIIKDGITARYIEQLKGRCVIG